MLLCTGFYKGFTVQHGNTQMRKFLSQKVANAAKTQNKPYQIHDTAIPGLVLRVQPTGIKIWKLIQDRRPRTLGRLPVMTFGMAKTKAEAIKKAEKEYGHVSNVRKVTLQEYDKQIQRDN